MRFQKPWPPWQDDAQLHGDALSRAFNPGQPTEPAELQAIASRYSNIPTRTVSPGPRNPFAEHSADMGITYADDLASADSAPAVPVTMTMHEKIRAAMETSRAEHEPAQPERLYKIGQLAELMSRDPDTLRGWMREGQFPDAPIRTDGRQRRWPLRYVEQILDIWRAENRKMTPAFSAGCFKLFELMEAQSPGTDV